MQDARPLATNAIIGLLSLIWGTTYFVIRVGLDDLPPFTAATARFATAGVLFAVLAKLFAAREGGTRPSLLLSLVMGFGSFGTSYAIVYWAETRLSSGLVSVLWGTFPLMLALFGSVWLRTETLSARQWFGIAVGFAGVVLLFATDIAQAGDDGWVYGAVLLLSPMVAALAQTYVKRTGAGVSSLLLNRNGICLAVPVLGTLAFVFERDLEPNWTPRALASVAYLAVVGTVVTFGLYYWALRHAPSHKMGMTTYLAPTIALAVGAGFRGEPLHLHTLVGSGLVLGCVAVVLAPLPAVRRRGRSDGPGGEP